MLNKFSVSRLMGIFAIKKRLRIKFDNDKKKSTAMAKKQCRGSKGLKPLVLTDSNDKKEGVIVF